MSETTADWTDDPAIGEANKVQILKERIVHINLQKAMGILQPKSSELNTVITQWTPKEPEINVLTQRSGSVTVNLLTAAKDWQGNKITTYEIYVDNQKHEILGWKEGEDRTIYNPIFHDSSMVEVKGRDSSGQLTKPFRPQGFSRSPI